MGWVVKHHAPAALPPGKIRYPLYRRLGGPQGRSGQVRKISTPTGIRGPDRPARSESLYRLRYSGPVRTSCTEFLSIHTFISIQPWRPGLAGNTAQSCDRYGSGTLHSGQVLGGSLPLLSPFYRYRTRNTETTLTCHLGPQVKDGFHCFVHTKLTVTE